jgi:hypothetical protein
MATNGRRRNVSQDFVEIRDQQVRRGCTVTVPRGTFRDKLRLGDWMRFERVVAGRTERLSGMVVDLDTDTVEIDVPYQQPRM